MKAEDLANPVKMAVSITHAGVVEIEKARTEPDKPTKYYPPVNIIIAHQMNGSVIQQRTVGNTQSVQLAETDKIEIDEFVKKVKTGFAGTRMNKGGKF